VTKRAAAVLELLEKADRKAPDGEALLGDLPLFASRPAAVSPPEASALEQALAEMHPDEMSPKVALEALYRLKGLLAKGRT
jgi:DNA mismatch repair protein MutS